jgi:hypothetical protein
VEVVKISGDLLNKRGEIWEPNDKDRVSKLPDGKPPGHGERFLAPSLGNICSSRGQIQTKLGCVITLRVKRKKIVGYQVHPIFQTRRKRDDGVHLVLVNELPFLSGPRIFCEERLSALFDLDSTKHDPRSPSGSSVDERFFEV